MIREKNEIQMGTKLMALSIWSNNWIVSKYLVLGYFQDTFWILFGLYSTLTKILGLEKILDFKF